MSGKDGASAALEAELESHIPDEVLNARSNRRNVYNKKQLKSSDGAYEFSTPRYRESSFEPQIVKEHETTISDEIEEKILSMYGLGMSYTDITKHIDGIYRISLYSYDKHYYR
ncbi:MAG: transposase [Sulfurimonadaceae bacterium]